MTLNTQTTHNHARSVFDADHTGRQAEWCAVSTGRNPPTDLFLCTFGLRAMHADVPYLPPRRMHDVLPKCIVISVAP